MLNWFKIFLRYFLTIAFVTFASAMFMYLISICFVAPVNRSSLTTNLGSIFPIMFIVYNIYLLVYNVLFAGKFYRLFIKGLFCFVIETALVLAILIWWGAVDLPGLSINIFSAGLCSFGLPYVHEFLNRKLQIKKSIN